jgi:intracellular sulfur oxidation DsrE/DsrF family protein
MKRLILVASLVLVSFGFTYRKPEPYRVAFDLTSRDSVDQTAVVRWIREITAASPNAQLEVVLYGKGLDLVMPERSIVSADVQHAIQNPNVTFKVCAIAMKNNKIEKSQLFPGVQIVPDGIYELISKQQEHWGYIKVSVSR